MRRSLRTVPHTALALTLALTLGACRIAPNPETIGTQSAAVDGVGGTVALEQERFWDALAEHCGNAYAGRLSDATAHYRARLEGRRLVAHFFDCNDDRMHIALHVDDDRSRNWILTKHRGTLRLKHDHRHEDGTEDTITQYGGDAPRPGLATRQIFPADAHTASILPERDDNFWFFDLVNDSTLEYGVHWPRMGHSVRMEFDLSTPVPPPPAPWGYERQAGA
jgi:hypothetical protein